jgi:NAD-reducing hydrogenase small subunit
MTLEQSRKPRLATLWLGGCSGCHMSFLDLDERLLDLAQKADIVFSPIVDVKEFPEDVDLAVVEGSVANEDNLEMIHRVRKRSRHILALGDCAAMGNVPALRNLTTVEEVLQTAYVARATPPSEPPVAPGIVPRLLPRVLPVHQVVDVDAFLPGCPPSADAIWDAITALLDGESAVTGNGHTAKFG